MDTELLPSIVLSQLVKQDVNGEYWLAIDQSELNKLASAIAALELRIKPPLSAPVAAFARKMQEALDANAHKGGRENWLKDSPTELMIRLDDEFRELNTAIQWGLKPTVITKEAADVANFAMFVADRCGGIEIDDSGGPQLKEMTHTNL